MLALATDVEASMNVGFDHLFVMYSTDGTEWTGFRIGDLVSEPGYSVIGLTVTNTNYVVTLAPPYSQDGTRTGKLIVLVAER